MIVEIILSFTISVKRLLSLPSMKFFVPNQDKIRIMEYTV